MGEIFAEETEFEVSELQKEIESVMQDNESIEDFELKDSLVAFAEYIRHNSIKENEQQILDYAKYLTLELNDYMVENKKIFDGFDYMLDAMKSKLYKLNDKEDEIILEERKLLKEVRSNFIAIYKIYKEDTSKKKKDGKFEIINYLMQTEQDYIYLKKIVKNMPDIVNTRYEDKHIVLYILDEYIDNFKKLLKDRNSKYINKDYLRAIYHLFTRNYMIKLTEEERNEIDSKLSDFIKYVKNTIIKQKRKNVAIAEIKKLKTSNYYYYDDSIELRCANDKMAEGRRQMILRSYEDLLVRNDRKDLTEQKNILFGISNFAATLKQEDRRYILQIHVLDIHQFIPSGNMLDNYFYNCLMNKEEVDQSFNEDFRFQDGKKYPTITYELTFLKSGTVEKLNIFSSKIKITDHYNNQSMVEINKDKDVLNYYEFYKKVINKNNDNLTATVSLEKMNEYFESILNKEFIKFVKKNDLPYIYYGRDDIVNRDYDRIMNNITNNLQNLEKKQFNIMKDVFEKATDDKHYSTMGFNKNGEYYPQLTNPLNYIGIETQRMIDDFLFNRRRLETYGEFIKLKKEYKNKYDYEVDALNKSIDYISTDELKKYKGKIKKIKTRLC